MHGADNPGDASSDPTPEPPPCTPVVSPNDQGVLRETEPKRANDNKDEAEKLIRGTRTIEWLQLVVNVTLLVVGIVAVCIYGRQLKVFNGQFQEMHAQTGILNQQAQQAARDAIEASNKVERQLGILQQQVSAARDSVRATQKQTEAAAAAMQIDQRAWLGLAGVDTEGGAETKDTFRVQGVSIMLHNSGKTPALKVRIECCMLTTRVWTDPIPDYDSEFKASEESRATRRRESRERIEEMTRQHPEMREQLLARDKEFWDSYESEMKSMYHQGGVIAPRVGTRFGVATSIQWGTRTNQQEPKTIYILGKVGYRDVFPGTPERSTKFCLLRTNGLVFSICPENNWME